MTNQKLIKVVVNKQYSIQRKAFTFDTLELYADGKVESNLGTTFSQVVDVSSEARQARLEVIIKCEPSVNGVPMIVTDEWQQGEIKND